MAPVYFRIAFKTTGNWHVSGHKKRKHLQFQQAACRKPEESDLMLHYEVRESTAVLPYIWYLPNNNWLIQNSCHI